MRRFIWRFASLALVGWLAGTHGLPHFGGASPLASLAQSNPAAVRAACGALDAEIDGRTRRDASRASDWLATVARFARAHGWLAAAARPCESKR
jgi:hypothetical protein